MKNEINEINEIHPSWPNDPPKVIDNLPPPKPSKTKCIIKNALSELNEKY